MSAGMASTTLSQIYYVFVSDLLATGHDNLARHQSHTSFGGQMLIAFYFYLAVMIFRICRFAAVEGWQSASIARLGNLHERMHIINYYEPNLLRICLRFAAYWT
ncbi:hypothetical protein Tco_0928857 [Tanacetum coccineum]